MDKFKYDNAADVGRLDAIRERVIGIWSGWVGTRTQLPGETVSPRWDAVPRLWNRVMGLFRAREQHPERLNPLPSDWARLALVLFCTLHQQRVDIIPVHAFL